MDNVKLGSANVHDCLIVVSHTALFSSPPHHYLLSKLYNSLDSLYPTHAVKSTGCVLLSYITNKG